MAGQCIPISVFPPRAKNCLTFGRCDGDALISVEHFQEAFRDIGTACIKLDSCVWKAASPQPNSNSDEAHEMFVDVVSSIG